MLKIGFVGVGSMGQCAHLSNYASLPDCEIVAIAEPRPELAKRVAARYAIPNVYPNGEAMLTGEKLDGVVASQPFERHGSIVLPLYRFGVPLLTEKPLASSVGVAERMLDALATGGSWHMVGYHKRSDPATIRANAEIERLKTSGELGRMTYIRVLMPAGDWIASGFNHLIRTDEPAPAIPTDPPDPGMDQATFHRYIAFVNYYIHQVNLIRHLLGEPYSVAYVDPSGLLLVGRSSGGIPCTLEMSPYSTTLDWQESVLVAFELGYVKLELPAPLASNRPGRVEILRDPGKGAEPVTLVPQLRWVHAMRHQAINFLAAIRGDAPPPCEAAEALQDLKLARDAILWKP
jgi:predicted dehydrogenase